MNNLTIQQTSSKSVQILYHNKRLEWFKNTKQAMGTKNQWLLPNVTPNPFWRNTPHPNMLLS
jgi:hypothetical protein